MTGHRHLKVAIVNQHPADMLGGSEIQCDIIARGLTERGHQVDYLAVGGQSGRDYQVPYGVHPVARRADAIADRVLLLKPDILYWRFNKHCFARSVARIRRAGIPVVFSVSHVRDVTRFFFQPEAWGPPGWKSMRRAFKEGWRLYREHGGFAHVDALVSNNPDNLGRVKVRLQEYIPNSMLDATRPFSWPRPYCLWVANIKNRKQPEKYVELARRLRDTGVDFLMVGQLQSRSYAALLEQGPENFHYLGERDLFEVNGMLAGALFLVHTCLPEGFSNNFIQAWLQSRTVVSLAFDPGGILVARNLGIYAHGDMEAFVASVRELIEDPLKARRLGDEARVYAQSCFSPAVNVARLEGVFMKVLGCEGETCNG